jgi:hypothetical protein
MSELPEYYVPASIKPTAYGIGSADGDGGYSMHHGPYPSVYNALEIVPESTDGRDMFVIRLTGTPGKDVLLYVWHEAGEQRYWERIDKITEDLHIQKRR